MIVLSLRMIRTAKRNFILENFQTLRRWLRVRCSKKRVTINVYQKLNLTLIKRKKIQKMVSRVTKSHHHVFHDDQNSKITFASKCKALVILGCIYKKSFLEISRSWP